MSYTAIMKTENGRVAKFQDGFGTSADAQTHADKHSDRFPDAFVVPTPDAPVAWWKVGSNNVVTVSEPVKTQTVIDAEIDAETDSDRSKGERADRLMLFRVLRAADPTYTKAQFRRDRRALIADMD
jgi:hypothetical protein